MRASFDRDSGSVAGRRRAPRLLQAVATGATAVLLVACSADGDAAPEAGRRDDPTAPTVPEDPAFRIGDTASQYTVSYRVDDLSNGTTGVATIRLEVRRPFESRREERSDEVTAAVIQLATFDRVKVADDLVVHRIPGVARHDIRVAPVLAAALQEGLIIQKGQRQVAGRRCQVLHSGVPLTAPVLQPSTPEQHVESCVDAAGIVLEETIIVDGAAAVHRIATIVTVDAEAIVADIDPGPVVVGVGQGGGSVVPVRPDAGSLGTFWELPPAARPAGFTHHGRFSVIPPEPERFTEDPSSGSPVAGTADVFRNDRDIVVVFQGGTLDGRRAYPTFDGALEVDGHDLGTGELLLSAVGSQVRFVAAGGHFVHVIGTLPPDALVDLARALVPSEGTGLVYGP